MRTVELLSFCGVLAILSMGSDQSTPPVQQPAAQQAQASEAAVLVGAGDIANCELANGSGAAATSRVLDRIQGTVFTAGDHAYTEGTAKQFQNCYDTSWGRHKARTHPSPGNHDYLTDKGKPYFDYFGESAGPDRRGYYSYSVGAWHVISLNSVIAADKKSPQVEWLKKDLADNPATCTLAYWHVPLFSSGPHGNDPHMLDIWKVLYDAHVDVVVNGHDHDYERFAPQTPNGKADPEKGIREFVVGTGGGGLYEFKLIKPNSEARANRSYGVLKLTLRAADYDWEFVPAAGEQFRDSGTGTCVK